MHVDKELIDTFRAFVLRTNTVSFNLLLDLHDSLPLLLSSFFLTLQHTPSHHLLCSSLRRHFNSVTSVTLVSRIAWWTHASCSTVCRSWRRNSAPPGSPDTSVSRNEHSEECNDTDVAWFRKTTAANVSPLLCCQNRCVFPENFSNLQSHHLQMCASRRDTAAPIFMIFLIVASVMFAHPHKPPPPFVRDWDRWWFLAAQRNTEP